MNAIKSLLGDGTGELSTTRTLVFLFGLMFIVLKFKEAWGNGLEFGEGELYALLTILGAANAKSVAEGLQDFLSKPKQPTP